MAILEGQAKDAQQYAKEFRENGYAGVVGIKNASPLAAGINTRALGSEPTSDISPSAKSLGDFANKIYELASKPAETSGVNAAGLLGVFPSAEGKIDPKADLGTQVKQAMEYASDAVNQWFDLSSKDFNNSYSNSYGSGSPGSGSPGSGSTGYAPGTSGDMQSYIDMINATTDKNNAWAAEQAQKQMDFQERMSNTQYQRAAADLKAAGLNPVLAAGNANSAGNLSGAMAQPDTSNTRLLAELSLGAMDSLSNSAVSLASGYNSRASNSFKNKLISTAEKYVIPYVAKAAGRWISKGLFG